MIIQCTNCNHSWFKEVSQLYQLNGATKIIKQFLCSNCNNPLHTDIPKSEYTLREYKPSQTNLKQDIIQTALNTWRNHETTITSISTIIPDEEFNSTLQSALNEHQEIVDELENLKQATIPHEPEIHTYEVSYQQEAFPWDQWSIIETTNQNHPLYEVYEDHSSGITMVLCTLVEADNKLDAKITGGTILIEHMNKKTKSKDIAI